MRSNHELDDVGNDALLVQLKRLVGSSNELTAELLAHLAEVDARGIYRECACATLYTYCVYELRLSEDEAQRRCRAARVARQFPLLFDMLADGSIHLTGILLLAPHLTRENHEELLARARYRTKREIEKLVAEVAPCADVPSLVQPLGPASAGTGSQAPARAACTWAALVQGWAGPVRQLAPGDGHGQAPIGELARARMAGDTAASQQSSLASRSEVDTALARENIDAARSAAPAREAGDALARENIDASGSSALAPEADTAPAQAGDSGPEADTVPARQAGGLGPEADTAPARQAGGLGPEADTAPARQAGDSAPSRLLGGQRYKVQFTADQSYVDLLEQARDLLQHEVSDRDLARVHRLAIEALLDKLSRRKYGARGAERPSAPRGAEQLDAISGAERLGAPSTVTMTYMGHVGVVEPVTAGTSASLGPARRMPQGRHIPSRIKRAVWERDAGRCTFTDARGQRCRETALLEFHHREAYARGGLTDLKNVTLHCRSHNGLAAEHELGRVFMNDKRGERGTSGDVLGWGGRGG